MSVKKLVQCLAVVGSLVVSAVSANAQNAQIRDGFWFSGGLGFGTLGCDNCGGRTNGLAGGISLGGTITPRFLLGVGSEGWTRSQQGATLTVATLDARVRFYPSTTGGFFLTGGVGLGSVTGSVSGLVSSTETGMGMVFGLGYDIRVAKNTSITPYWNGFAMRNSNTNANVGQLGLAITLH
jgi:Outer membrane protein beta-barrel domain